VVVEGDPEMIPVRQQPISGIGEVAPGQIGDVQIGSAFVDAEGNQVDAGMVMQGPMGPYVLGDPVEYVGEQSIRCEYVHWEDFVMSPARGWPDVTS
jgi:hypothetical protein